MDIRSNDIVAIVKDGKEVGLAQVLEADYSRKESERYVVRTIPADESDYPRNAYAGERDLTFKERPRF